MRTLFTTIVLALLIFNAAGQESDSTSADIYSKANTQLSNYQFEEAIQSLNICLKSDSNNQDLLYKLAFCQAKLGRLKQAKNSYSIILSLDSNNIKALNQIAVIYANESNYEAATEQYKRLLQIDSLNAYYNKQIAELALKSGKIEDAILHFKKSNQLNPLDIETISSLCEIYQAIKFYDAADSLTNLGRMLDSTNIKLILFQAKSAYRQKKYEAVVENINALFKLKTDTSINELKLLGVSYFQIKKHNKAIALLNQALELEQDSEIIHYYLGLAYKEAGNLESSVYHFEKAIDSGVSNNIASYYTNLAIVFEEKGEYPESIKAYQSAYKSSYNKILLYHLARNYDTYYKDKNTAIDYYKDYSKHRISELKKVIHFEIDTLN